MCQVLVGLILQFSDCGLLFQVPRQAKISHKRKRKIGKKERKKGRNSFPVGGPALLVPAPGLPWLLYA
jgi:hypothetical protein